MECVLADMKNVGCRPRVRFGSGRGIGGCTAPGCLLCTLSRLYPQCELYNPSSMELVGSFP